MGQGEFEIIEGEFKKGRMTIFLKGGILKGAFSIFEMKGKPKQWLLVKKQDEYANENFVLKTFINERKLSVKQPPCKTD